ncbi:MAG TPA: hypothetical protein ENL27_02990 [Candidatus Parcubacteria bacterium]|nr:hypothetical protein [Candidatus Parcubacteria bacterium]
MPRLNFENPNFENPAIRKMEREEKEQENIEKLESLIREISWKLKKEGVPVAEDLRIDVNAYSHVYSEKEINKDKELVEECLSEWYPGLSQEEIKKERMKADGEKLEMLSKAIFTRGLGEDFIVARSSLYDDIKNKADNIILEKSTGNIVCALDDIGESKGSRYKEKVEKVMAKNKKEDGVKLKYGLKMEENEKGENKLCLSKVENVPLFYLVLPKDHIDKGLEELVPSLGQLSEHEEKLFNYFLGSILYQVNFLELERGLNPALKDRLSRFKEILQRFNSKNSLSK